MTGDYHQHHDREDPAPAPDGGEKGAVLTGGWLEGKMRDPEFRAIYERESTVEAVVSLYAERDSLRARVAELERVIEEAEHAPWCAFKDVAGARFGDHDGRCDCFKSKASVR